MQRPLNVDIDENGKTVGLFQGEMLAREKVLVAIFANSVISAITYKKRTQSPY